MMGIAPTLMVFAILGVTYGWRSDGSDGVEYIIQIPPDQLSEIQRQGTITSTIDPAVRGRVTKVIVQVGTEPLPRENPSPIPADQSRTRSFKPQNGSGFALPPSLAGAASPSDNFSGAAPATTTSPTTSSNLQFTTGQPPLAGTRVGGPSTDPVTRRDDLWSNPQARTPGNSVTGPSTSPAGASTTPNNNALGYGTRGNPNPNANPNLTNSPASNLASPVTTANPQPSTGYGATGYGATGNGTTGAGYGAAGAGVGTRSGTGLDLPPAITQPNTATDNYSFGQLPAGVTLPDNRSLSGSAVDPNAARNRSATGINGSAARYSDDPATYPNRVNPQSVSTGPPSSTASSNGTASQQWSRDGYGRAVDRYGRYIDANGRPIEPAERDPVVNNSYDPPSYRAVPPAIATSRPVAPVSESPTAPLNARQAQRTINASARSVPPPLGSSEPRGSEPSGAGRAVGGQPMLFNLVLMLSLIGNIYLAFWMKTLRQQFRDLVAAKRLATSEVAA